MNQQQEGAKEETQHVVHLTNGKLKGLRRKCQMKKISEEATGNGDARTLPASLVYEARSQRSCPHSTITQRSVGRSI
jgi:hypothetical protein